MANYWYYNKDGKLYSSNEAKLWLAKDNCMHFGDLPQHVKDLNGLLPLTVKHEWVDLTRTQIQNVYFAVLEEHRGSHQMQGQLAFGEALQSAIKEKNT